MKKINWQSIKKLIPYTVLIIPLVIGIRIIANDQIAFWYDPARDFLLALENLKKITLIGQPSGIPGLFYGPYWIWMISLGLLINMDPRVVTILIATIPYTILFPLYLYKLRNVFGNYYWVTIWLLFFGIFSSYTVSLWNINPAPLIILILTYYATLIGTQEKIKIKNILITGILVGILISFHISFGIGVALATTLFTGLLSVYKSTSIFHNVKPNNSSKLINLIPSVLLNLLYQLSTLLVGITITFIPFLVFELRHDFNQLKVIQKVITDAFLYNSAAVGVTGLTKPQIYAEFYEKLGTYFPLKFSREAVIAVVSVFLGFYIIRLIKIQDKYKKYKLSFLLLILICLSSILLIYTNSKNPVWEYHFIGLEIFFLLLIGLITSEFRLLKLIVTIVALVNLTKLAITTFSPTNTSPYSMSSLHTKKHIVDIIYIDAGSGPFTVFVYSPAIYTYDYDYIFNWYSKTKYTQIPEHDIKNNTPVYLVIPKTDESIKNDFINYKTPHSDFVTLKEWNIDDNSVIIKRIHKSINQ